MAPVSKAQRIRDPLHNLIEFGTDEFERTMWGVIQTRPFQRLRRIKQLGFSEFVFPGATHTRFAHSLGVFHIARALMNVICRDEGRPPHQANVALAAALVHDVGHGMFSHAFEDVGHQLNLKMAIHENVSDALIRHDEISSILRVMGRSFADEVADVVKSKKPGDLYSSVVSSQFDADRLDYMQRDRMMTGVQGSGVDATWILANLEVATVQNSVDGEAAGEVQTLVLGPKAYHAAEHYVLSLFQLYPNVYLHKTTRGVEKMFSALILRISKLVLDGLQAKTGLPSNHPICLFLMDPENLERALSLDDTVFWGALPLLMSAEDELVQNYSKRIQERILFKCIDVRREIEGMIPIAASMTNEDRRERDAKVTLKVKSVMKDLRQWASECEAAGKGGVLFDEYKRSPYKRFQDSQTLLNQILIRQVGEIQDMAHLSSVVAGAESFEISRIYLAYDDIDGRSAAEKIVKA